MISTGWNWAPYSQDTNGLVPYGSYGNLIWFKLDGPEKGIGFVSVAFWKIAPETWPKNTEKTGCIPQKAVAKFHGQI